jgi:hypothetical protein
MKELDQYLSTLPTDWDRSKLILSQSPITAAVIILTLTGDKTAFAIIDLLAEILIFALDQLETFRQLFDLHSALIKSLTKETDLPNDTQYCTGSSYKNASILVLPFHAH